MSSARQTQLHNASNSTHPPYCHKQEYITKYQLRECVVMQMVQNKGPIAPTILNFKRRLTPITNAGLNLYLKISMVGADSPNLQYVKQARYDIEYLTCSKKLMCSQLSPHGTNRKIAEKNKLKVNPVRSHACRYATGLTVNTTDLVSGGVW